MDTIDCDDFGISELERVELILKEWAAEHPVMYLESIARRYRKRLRRCVPKSRYLKALRELWVGRSHVEKCTLLLYVGITTNKMPLGELKKMVLEMIEMFERRKIEPGTMVGVQAAQSVGESMTQASLNTFHLAGAKRSMTTGILRLKELLNCTKNVPVPYFHVGPAVEEDLLLDKRLRDYVVGTPLVWDLLNDCEATLVSEEGKKSSRKCRWEIRVRLMEGAWNLIHQSRHIPQIVHSLLHCDNGVDMYTKFPRSTPKVDVFKRLRSLMEYHISGVPGAKLLCEGNLFLNAGYSPTLADLYDACPNLELTKLSTNKIDFIQSTFGIEAAREYLIKEIKSVLADEGIHLNVRHIMLIVDNMTYHGSYQANLYSAISLEDNPILKATFQQQTDTFARAAAKGVVDKLNDVSSQICMGKTVSAGTGVVRLIVEEPGIISDVVEKNEVKSPEFAPYSPKSSPGFWPCSPHPIMPNLEI